MNILLFFIGLFLTGTLFFSPIGIPLIIISIKYKGIKKRYSKETLQAFR